MMINKWLYIYWKSAGDRVGGVLLSMRYIVGD